MSADGVELDRLQAEARLLDSCEEHGLPLEEGYSSDAARHADGTPCMPVEDPDEPVHAVMSYQACALKAQMLLLEAEAQRESVFGEVMDPDDLQVGLMLAQATTNIAAVWAALAAVADHECAP